MGEGDRIRELRAALEATADYGVEQESVDGVPDRLGERPAVDCLWIDGSVPDATDLVAEAADRDPVTRILFAGTDDDVAVAAEATAAGASEYVGPDASVEDCVRRVETAVDRAIDRRHDVTKRSALDAMLSELGVSLYAKDERARHVLLADVHGAPDPDEAFGKTDPEVYPDFHGDLEAAYEDDLRVIEDGERVEGRLEPLSAESDGWMRTTKVPWQEDGEIRGLVGLTMEVTEFKRRERELLRQIARLQQIPDYVNHDLKNPLGIAQGYLDMAQAGDEEALETVADSLDRMEELLEDFHSLTTQELDSGSDERPLLLADHVEGVWKYVSTEGATLDLAGDPDTWLVADESQLRPLLKNLLGNAVDHAGEDVTVRVGTVDDGFYIEDDGPGIPSDERYDVFEQGYTTAASGTGLGLAIVEESARLHGWDVSVADSTLGGARFEVRGGLLGTPLEATRAVGDPIALTESVDVGDVEVAGSASGSDGSYRVAGAGENVWGLVNEFQFLHAPVDGDVRIEGRITGVERASEWSKAGFMIRSGLEEDAAYGFVGEQFDGAPEVLWRSNPGDRGSSAQVGGVDSEYEWFRIDRVGDDLSCSISADGEEWAFVDRRTVALDDRVYVGLAVCSVSAGDLVRATFEDVAVHRLEE